MSLINSTAIPSGATAYEIEQSLRFDEGDSYNLGQGRELTRTLASAGNRRTWTYSCWHKPQVTPAYNGGGNLFFAGASSGTYFTMNHDSNGKINLHEHNGSAYVLRRKTTQVFRDPSSWYHFLLAVDTTQGTAANRVKLYVNGVQITAFDNTDNPSQNYDTRINSVVKHHIGGASWTNGYLNGYLAEINFIEGAAKAPADFGETGDYGEWKPIAYSGSYGTNGFYLPFKQDYTVEGFSTVTWDGNTTDQYIGGVGFQPDLVWIKHRNGAGDHMLMDSIRGVTKNLISNTTVAEETRAEGLQAFSADGYTLGTNDGNLNREDRTYVGWNWDMGTTTNPKHQISAVGNVKNSTTQNKIGATSIAFDGTGDRLDIPASNLMESDEGTIECWVYMNVLADGSQVYYNPPIYNKGDVYQALTVRANGKVTSHLYTGATNELISTNAISTGSWNHLALTWNSDGRKIWINGVLNGTSDISLTSMQAGGKNATFHIGEGTSSSSVGLNAYVDELRVSKIARYTANFTPYTSARTEDNDTTLLLHSNTNNNSTLFVDSSDGGDVNNNGSIESIVAANPTYGQSIVSATYSGSGTKTFGHGLSSAPELIIGKNRSAVANWGVYNSTIGAGKYLLLDTTGAAVSSTSIWGNTAPTSTVFSSNVGWLADAGNDVIFYCFHSVTGYSKFGTYEGNGSTSHAITTGFKPAFVLTKNVDSPSDPQDWFMFDNTRSPSNPIKKLLKPNSSNAEGADSTGLVNFTDTGFTWLKGNDGINKSGDTFIYMAFADKREYAYWLDQSGNNNDWTSNNLTESDVMVDSPTNNFATLNPLTTGSYITLSEGNLKALGNSAADGGNTRSTMGMSTGLHYAEVYIGSNTYEGPGISQIAYSDRPNNGNPQVGQSPSPGSVAYKANGTKIINGSGTTYGNSYANGDIVGIALDATNGAVYFSKNGVWQNSGNPTSGSSKTGAAITWTAPIEYVFAFAEYNGSNCTVNFGQDSSFAGAKTAQGNQDGNDIGDFYYTPPTGFLALCTSNLPDVAVVPSENFNTVLYTGTGSSNAITGVGFQPDFAWIKDRTNAYQHQAFDAVRGVTKKLHQSTSAAEATDTTSLTAFGADGFTVSTNAGLNTNTASYVAWNWKANGSGSSNTNGSINSTVSANVDAGFSIVKFHGTGANATVGHGLSKAPELVICKDREAANGWGVGQFQLSNTKALYLDLTIAFDTNNYWNSTNPSSTLISLGTSGATNANNEMIAYAFHSVDGYSKVGSYTGNGNADGAFVYTGFRPAFVLCKRTDGGDSWIILDSTRDTYNVANHSLWPNLSDAEGQVANKQIDIVSNGFKHRQTSNQLNGANNYIYLAFAETPFKYSNAR